MDANVEKTLERTSLFKRKNIENPDFITKNFSRKNEYVGRNSNDSDGKMGAKVTISEAIRDFSKIKKAVDDAPPTDRNNRIMELKKQINDGTFKVDYEALADKILTNEF